MLSRRVYFIVAILLLVFAFEAYSHIPCQSQRTKYEAALKKWNSERKDIEKLDKDIFKWRGRRTMSFLKCSQGNRFECGRYTHFDNAVKNGERKLGNMKNTFNNVTTPDKNTKALALSECLATAYRNCETCQVKHTKLPADPCRGFLCLCGRLTPRCDCPYRPVNSPGCNGSSTGDQGSGSL
jgi:hypothetical protein